MPIINNLGLVIILSTYQVLNNNGKKCECKELPLGIDIRLPQIVEMAITIIIDSSTTITKISIKNNSNRGSKTIRIYQAISGILLHQRCKILRE